MGQRELDVQKGVNIDEYIEHSQETGHRAGNKVSV